MSLNDTQTIIIELNDDHYETIMGDRPFNSSPPYVYLTSGDNTSFSRTETEGSVKALVVAYNGEPSWRGFSECKNIYKGTTLRTPCNNIANAFYWALAFSRAGIGTIYTFDGDNNFIQKA